MSIDIINFLDDLYNSYFDSGDKWDTNFTWRYFNKYFKDILNFIKSDDNLNKIYKKWVKLKNKEDRNK